MVNPIVTIDISIVSPPAPDNLQRTGALISQGGTSLGTGSYSLLTQASDLDALLPSAVALSSIVWASTNGGTVTATASAVHGIAVGSEFITTIAGCVPTGYNGTYRCIVTTTTAFTFYKTSDPGASTTVGTYTRRNVGELQSMVDTFFGQGGSQSVYVLECGAGEPEVGIAALSEFISTQPSQMFYAYLVPRSWDAHTDFLALIATLEAPESKTYFFTTTTLQNYAAYTSAMKCVVALIEAPAYGQWSTNLVTAATWSGGVATVTTTTAHGVKPGQYFTLTGISPTGYNGTYIARPGTTGTSLLYAKASTPGSYVSGGSLVKSLYSSDGIPATEFSLATYFQYILSQNPNGTTKVTPLIFTFLYGVTAYPLPGNGAILTTLATANINYVATAAAGGLSENMLRTGHTMDGKPFKYWYSVDWYSINLVLNLTNAIINGSNNSLNPLEYNQEGINRLEQVVFNTASTGIQYGLFTGTPNQYGFTQQEFNNRFNDDDFDGQFAINAVPFVSYTALNPSDYADGRYGGLSSIGSPLQGFEEIIFNAVFTQFVG